VVLGLFEQRPERLADVGQSEIGGLGEPLAVAVELASLQGEVRLQRTS